MPTRLCIIGGRGESETRSPHMTVVYSLLARFGTVSDLLRIRNILDLI
jgi:hypothetical protein